MQDASFIGAIAESMRSSMISVSGLGGMWNVDGFCYGACSVAASYKPPILVTRVRLPACAFSFARDALRCPITCECFTVIASDSV